MFRLSASKHAGGDVL